MTNTELRAAIKKAEYVYGYVSLNQDDGEYIRLHKADALRAINGANEVDARVEYQGATVYIN